METPIWGGIHNFQPHFQRVDVALEATSAQESNGGALKAIDLRSATHLTQVGDGIHGRQSNMAMENPLQRFFF